jgi:hypothetical protein
MVDPIPPYLSPEHLKRLQQLADASRLRAALYASPKPPPVRDRSRQYPGGRPNPWRSAPAHTPPGVSAGHPGIRCAHDDVVRSPCTAPRTSGAHGQPRRAPPARTSTMSCTPGRRTGAHP